MLFIKEIQGLRAFAVLAVILVHLGVSWLPGGFIGVDIFFVISGYLITGLLLREYQQSGDISLVAFYRRRANRLLPALLVTCLISVFAGFLIFSDEHFASLLDSAVAAFFSVSNVYFFSQVGYFDSDAITKPLLHTWSLGVEEQFYLTWPLLVLVLLRFFGVSGAVFGIVFLGTGSFILNAAFISFDANDQISSVKGWRSVFLDANSTAFYLMPFRIFEFALGALMVWVTPVLARLKSLYANIIFVTALGGLLLLMVLLSEKSVFPYYNALMVALLAAGVIACASRSTIAAFLLGNKLAVFVGGISYSLYLVHWPVIVFGVAILGNLGAVDVALLLLLTFLLGYALNIWVENRFRHPRSNDHQHGFFSVIARGGLFGIFLLSLILIGLLKNVHGRIPEQRQTLSNSEWRTLERQKYCESKIAGLPDHIFTCQNNRHSDRTIFVWGDSHAMHLIAGLSEVYPDHNIAIAYLSACSSQSGFSDYVHKYSSQALIDQCVTRNNEFLQWAKNYEGKAIVYISNAKRFLPEKMAAINNQHVAMLEDYGLPAYVLGDIIRPGVELAQCYSVPAFVMSDSFLRSRCKTDTKTIVKELRYSKRMAELSKSYISVHDIQCPNGSCNFDDGAGRVSFRDSHHLSPLGSIYWIKKINESGLLPLKASDI